MMERKRVIACVPVLCVVTVCAASVAEAQLREPEQRFFISIDGGFQGREPAAPARGRDPRRLRGGSDHGDRLQDRPRGRDSAGQRGRPGYGRISDSGLGYNLSSGTGEGAVTVAAPHPLFVDRPRSVSTDLTDLKHQEDLFHFQALLILPLNDRIQLQFFGGPTAMTVKQASVIGATTVEVGPPYSAVTLESVAVRQLTKTALGFNVGLDLAYMFRERYGAGLFVQYTGGSIDFDEWGYVLDSSSPNR